MPEAAIMRRWSLPTLVLLVMLVGTAFLTLRAAANPIASDPIDPFHRPLPVTDTSFFLDGDPLEVILVLVVLNLAVNMFWYSAILYIITSRTGVVSGLGRRTGWEFLSLVLLAVVFITITGAVIDYYIVAQNARFYSLEEWHRVMAWDLLRWVLGVGLIFASVIIPTMGLLLTSWKYGVLVALVMAGVSPLWWVLADIFGWVAPFAMIGLSVVASPFLLRALVRAYLERPSHAPPVGTGT